MYFVLDNVDIKVNDILFLWSLEIGGININWKFNIMMSYSYNDERQVQNIYSGQVFGLVKGQEVMERRFFEEIQEKGFLSREEMEG